MKNIERKELPKRSDAEINKLVDELMTKMTLKEKIGQMYQATYTGGEITQGQIVDIALTSNGNSKGQLGSETFQGENIFYRKASGEFISYFVKVKT